MNHSTFCRPQNLLVMERLEDMVQVNDMNFSKFIFLIKKKLHYDDEQNMIVYEWVDIVSMHITNELKWRTALFKMHTESSIHFFFTVRRRESWNNHERVFWLYHDMNHLEVFHETFLFENSLTSESSSAEVQDNTQSWIFKRMKSICYTSDEIIIQLTADLESCVLHCHSHPLFSHQFNHPAWNWICIFWIKGSLSNERSQIDSIVDILLSWTMFRQWSTIMLQISVSFRSVIIIACIQILVNSWVWCSLNVLNEWTPVSIRTSHLS